MRIILDTNVFIVSLASHLKYHLVNPYFTWQLIEADKDDNKFVDCAIAANTDYIVTHDKHFNVLKKIDFPKVNIINIQQLKQLLA